MTGLAQRREEYHREIVSTPLSSSPPATVFTVPALDYESVFREANEYLAAHEIAHRDIQPYTAMISYEPPSPCEVQPDGSVAVNRSRMEEGRPYPFQVGELWFVAVNRPEGVSIYACHE